MTMLLEFEKKVAVCIRENFLVDSAERVLLAVSGGADSTALLYAMQTLKTENILSADLVCAHINHQLRGTDADVDEDFVIAQARDLNLTIITKKLEVRGFAHKSKLSIETAARMMRIETLLNIAKINNCSSIATAHHKNDNAETILHRLVRGTGFRGLAGIWPLRFFDDDIRFIRPLLSITRNEIIEYLKKRSLKWRRDHTNADCTYTRNFIRHKLLPVLQQDCTGSLVEQLSILAASTRNFYSMVCNCADKAWPQLADSPYNKVKLNVRLFLAQPPPVKVELVRRGLTAIGSGQRDLTRLHFRKILRLAEQNVGGRKIELPGGFIVRREFGNLIFARSENSSISDELINKSINVEMPGQTKCGKLLIDATIHEVDECEIERFKTEKNKYVEWFDLEKLKLPLEIRLRKAGDRFWPLGLGAEKKIGKFLTAAKVPHHLRRKMLIIEDSEKIIWLWPVRIGEQAKISYETQKVLQLNIVYENQAK